MFICSIIVSVTTQRYTSYDFSLWFCQMRKNLLMNKYGRCMEKTHKEHGGGGNGRNTDVTTYWKVPNFIYLISCQCRVEACSFNLVSRSCIIIISRQHTINVDGKEHLSVYYVVHVLRLLGVWIATMVLFNLNWCTPKIG